METYSTCLWCIMTIIREVWERIILPFEIKYAGNLKEKVNNTYLHITLSHIVYFFLLFWKKICVYPTEVQLHPFLTHIWGSSRVKLGTTSFLVFANLLSFTSYIESVNSKNLPTLLISEPNFYTFFKLPFPLFPSTYMPYITLHSVKNNPFKVRTTSSPTQMARRA